MPRAGFLKPGSRADEDVSMHGYDIIGDIHGHADRLIELLEMLKGKYVYYNDISFSDNPGLGSDMVVPEEEISGIPWYLEDEIPVFVGHYWLDGAIKPLSKNIACVDYSVAMGGKLAAYRWDGELEIDALKFVYT